MSKDMRCRNVFVMHSGGARNVSGTSFQINRTDKRNMKRTLLLIAVIVIVGALPVFWQYGTFMICTDYMRQQIPFIMETKRMLESGTPFWSWNTYVGDNFWAGYAFYSLTSPFVWLVALLPYRCIVHGLFLTLVLKYMCAFATSYAYIRKMGVGKQNSRIGGLMYCFSSYAITNSFYYHFFEPLIVFPLLLLGIERFIRSERYSMTTLTLAAFAVAFVNYYFAVCSFLAAIIYLFCRFVFSDVRVPLRRIMAGVGATALGVAMSSIVLLPTALHLMGNPRITRLSGLDYTAWWYALDRLRTLLMPQVIEQPTSLFRLSGWNSCSVTLPVVGVLMAFLYWWRVRRDWISWLLLLSVLVYLTPCTSAFSMMTNPNYVRWGYALSLFLSLATAMWMERDDKRLSQSCVTVYACCGLSVFALAVCLGHGWQAEVREIPELIAGLYVLLFLVSILCLLLYVRSGARRMVLVGGMAVCVVMQMWAFYAIRTEPYLRHVDHEHWAMARTYVLDNDVERSAEDMHYRTAFISPGYPNVAMLLNRPDVQTFHSVPNNAAMRVFALADSTGCHGRVSFTPNINHRSFYALMSVREIVTFDNAHDSVLPAGLSVVAAEDSCRNNAGDALHRYLNVDYIPMGFTYTRFMTESMADSLLSSAPSVDMPAVMLDAMVVPDSLSTEFSRVLPLCRPSVVSDIDSLVRERRVCSSQSFNGTTRGFTAMMTMPRENYVFFSVVADKGFTAFVDGEPVPVHPVNHGMSAILVPAGTHEVEFRFVPRGLMPGLAISLLALAVLLLLFMAERRYAIAQCISHNHIGNDA